MPLKLYGFGGNLIPFGECMIYQYSDETIEKLNKIIIKEFNKAKSQCITGFDELNYFKICDRMYKRLDKIFKKYYSALVRRIYEEYDGIIDEIEEMEDLINNYYNTPNALTEYDFEKELERKKDRLVESLYASDKGDMHKAFDKAKKLLANQVAQYSDIFSFISYIEALKSRGVKEVKWRTEGDYKVCSLCLPLEGKIYPIDKIPNLQHWNCRCWVEPI